MRRTSPASSTTQIDTERNDTSIPVKNLIALSFAGVVLRVYGELNPG
jgi:hypothetical protein